MTTLSKTFHFNAAHRLYGLDHMPLCATNVHGHNFIVTITVKPNINHTQVMDFKQLNHIKTWIDENWDHGFLCHQDDPVGHYLKDQGMRVYQFDQAPTTEYVCKYLAKKGQSIMGNQCIISCVSIQETPSYTAHYHIES